MTSAQLLAKLLSITPVPPDSFDVDELLAAAAAMLAARQQLLDTATQIVMAPFDPSELAELHCREAAWREAIASAQRVVGTQRIGVSRMRKYAPVAAAR